MLYVLGDSLDRNTEPSNLISFPEQPDNMSANTRAAHALLLILKDESARIPYHDVE